MALTTVPRIYFSMCVQIVIIIMTINTATNDGVLIAPATKIVIASALETAVAAPHAIHHATHQTPSDYGSVTSQSRPHSDRIITNSESVKYTIAMPVVTDTTAIVVLAVVTVASAVRTNVLHMTVAHVKERPGAPSMTVRGAMVSLPHAFSELARCHCRTNAQPPKGVRTQHRSVQWNISDCKPSPSSSSTQTRTQHGPR